MESDCCDECSYWEDRADINTENEIKASSLGAAFAKKNLVNKLTNIKAPSGKHKAKGVVDSNKDSLHTAVGTDSSQNIKNKSAN